MSELQKFSKGYLEKFHEPRLISGYSGKVCTDACFMMLEEIPSEDYRVTIKGYNEVLNLDDIEKENDFYVDYTNNYIYFHKSKMGQTITVDDYYGIGLNFIGASRIIVRSNVSEDVIETLEDLIEQAKLCLEAITTLGGVVEVIEQLQEDTETSKGVDKQLKETIKRGEATIETIKNTENKSFVINTSDWVSTTNGYKYTLTHNLQSINLHVSMIDLTDNMAYPSQYKIIDVNTIEVYAMEKIKANIVISARYYNGLGDNIGDNIVQEVIDARVGMTSLGDKIRDMDNQLTEKIDDIQIGTRNYLLNTGLKDDASSFTGLNNEITRVTTKKTPSGNNCFYFKISNNTSNVYRGVAQEVTSGFSVGDTMTFSAWTYITDEVAEDEGLFVEVVGVASDDSTRTFIVNKQVDSKNVNKWVKYEMTFVVPKNTVKLKCWSFVVKNGSWYTGDYKLEKGNKASDWSPNPTDIYNAILESKKSLYPVGSLYFNIAKDTNPGTLLGFGTWERIAQGKTLIGVDTSDNDFNTAGKTGGSKTHKHMSGGLVADIGAIGNDTSAIGYSTADAKKTRYTLGITGNGMGDISTKNVNHGTSVSGETASSSSLQPYITVYIWRRIA